MRRACFILAAASSFALGRNRSTGFGLAGNAFISNNQVNFFEMGGNTWEMGIRNEGGLMPLQLDADWLRRLKETRHDQIIDRVFDSALNQDWKRQITQATVLLGRSLLSTNLTDAFLLNVIGLETLLTRQGERNGKILSQRVLGLTGWNFVSDLATYEKHVKNIHAIRCEFVHDSDYRNLTVENLLWSDAIFRNCLWNICLYPKFFPAKEAMADLVDGYASSRSWPKAQPDLMWTQASDQFQSDKIILYDY